jgi:hypothetical protein
LVVYGSGKRLEVIKVVTVEDGVNICLLGEMHGMICMITFDLNAKHPV